jgi:hypothetical protein
LPSTLVRDEINENRATIAAIHAIRSISTVARLAAIATEGTRFAIFASPAGPALTPVATLPPVTAFATVSTAGVHTYIGAEDDRV